eukprot:TRINITY_DN1749_c0_g2_i1.p2 TRINITY_DN1749_c0_g2~~TRINITY_DN1749_c0_g2_i1.p2  ORF type:complete len:230 (+),score=54.58 TRINITY_DN1749_c0_g2_i1:125-814(+)
MLACGVPATGVGCDGSGAMDEVFAAASTAPLQRRQQRPASAPQLVAQAPRGSTVGKPRVPCGSGGRDPPVPSTVAPSEGGTSLPPGAGQAGWPGKRPPSSGAVSWTSSFKLGSRPGSAAAPVQQAQAPEQGRRPASAGALARPSSAGALVRQGRGASASSFLHGTGAGAGSASGSGARGAAALTAFAAFAPQREDENRGGRSRAASSAGDLRAAARPSSAAGVRRRGLP